MHDLLRYTIRGNEIEPPAGSELRVIESQNIFGDRITAAETVKQPSIELVASQRVLQ